MTVRAPISAEQALLLLAARADDGPDIDAEVHRLLGPDTDWTLLVRTAIAHRLVAPLARRLRDIGEPLVPDDIAYALQYRVEKNGENNGLLMAAVADVARTLHAEAIAAVFIDGPTLALQAYDSLLLRDPVNPLLLASGRDNERLRQIMGEHGFRWGEGNGAAAAAYRRAEDDTVIEVCSTVASGAGAIEHQALVRRATMLGADPDGAPVPAVEDALQIACVRGDADDWRRFGAVCDIAHLLHTHRDLDLRSMEQRAREQGWAPTLLVGLGLSAPLPIECGRPALSDLAAAQHLEEIRRRSLAHAPTNATPSRKRAASVDATSSAAPDAKARNEAHWSARSQSWERWAEPARVNAAAFNRALMDAIGVQRGQRLLDLACGVGDTALELAAAVGADGFVAATDLAYPMLSKARRRAHTAALENLRCCAADMENLPFADDSFDGLVCRLGIMYAPDPRRALREARRVLTPGGRAAFLVCGPRDDNPVLGLVHDVLAELFEMEGEDEAIAPFRFAAPGRLAGIMEDSGFQDVSDYDLPLRHRAAQTGRFWQASVERGLGLPLEVLPSATLAELDARMSAAFAPYLIDDGYELPSVSRITVGTAA